MITPGGKVRVLAAFPLLCLFSSPVSADEPATHADGSTLPDGETQLRILRAGTREPVTGAVVEIQGQARVTDSYGQLTLRGLTPGVTLVQIRPPGEEESLLTATLVPGEILTLYLRTAPPPNTMVITGTRDNAPVSERPVSAQEIRQIPGSFGDPVRALQNLPGVSHAPLGSSLLIVRGSDVEDTGYSIDGIRTPQVFHFLGVTTILNAEMLDKVTFLPGGFGVRFGRTLQAQVDLETNLYHPPHAHGQLEIDLFDTTFYGTGPIDERSGYTFSVRRSYIDTLAEPVLNRLDTEYRYQAPRYWDYQLAVDRTVHDRHQVRALLVGSSDQLAVYGKIPEDADPDQAEQAVFDYQTTFTQGQIHVRSVWSDTISTDVVVSAGPQRRYLQAGLAEIDWHPFMIDTRADLHAQLRPDLQLNTGLDLQTTRESASLFAPTGGDGYTSYESQGWTFSPSPWAELVWTPGDHLRLVPGLRIDPFIIAGQEDMWTVDPRLATHYQLDEHWTLKGSVGRYSAFPKVWEFLEGLGDPSLGPEHAYQGVIGVERQLPYATRLDLTGYGTWSTDRVTIDLNTLTQGGDEEGEPLVPYDNEGRGRAAGVEVLLRRDFGTHFWGWAAYTWQISQQQESPDEPWILFGYDQTHLITLLASRELPRDWQVGGRWRYNTGNPYTPVVGRIYNLDSSTWSPVEGSPNSARYPNFHSLDIRAEKHWTYDTWKLALFLDLQNAYSHRNVESHYYSFDYSQQYFVLGLPILPVFGIQGEW